VLRHLGVDSLVVGGVATNACVESTVRDAADSGYRCLLVDDACAGYDAAFHEMTMRSFRNVFGRIGTTDDALQELAAASSPAPATVSS
jgi:nicotinamidase-related amidase